MALSPLQPPIPRRAAGPPPEGRSAPERYNLFRKCSKVLLMGMFNTSSVRPGGATEVVSSRPRCISDRPIAAAQPAGDIPGYLLHDVRPGSSQEAGCFQLNCVRDSMVVQVMPMGVASPIMTSPRCHSIQEPVIMNGTIVRVPLSTNYSKNRVGGQVAMLKGRESGLHGLAQVS